MRCVSIPLPRQWLGLFAETPGSSAGVAATQERVALATMCVILILMTVNLYAAPIAMLHIDNKTRGVSGSSVSIHVNKDTAGLCAITLVIAQQMCSLVLS